MEVVCRCRPMLVRDLDGAFGVEVRNADGLIAISDMTYRVLGVQDGWV